MGKVYKYQKITNAITTICVIEPDYNLLKTESRVTEIGVLDGYTYISVPDGLALPADQPVELIEANYADDLIDDQVVEKIREKYSVNDEIKMLRLAPSAETAAWNEYVEECRAWGKAQKEMLYVGD